MRKKISIVTPTFNEEQNVEKLCKLISEELNKTNYDYEHIVIDNCSTDNTVKILKKISNENKNLKIIVNTKLVMKMDKCLSLRNLIQFCKIKMYLS